MGDIGVRATQEILENLQQKVKENHIKQPEECKELLIQSIKEQMEVGETAYRFEHEKSVVLVVGVNGVGKTTSVGKLAGKLKAQGRKVVLAAADTFRAAAGAQLEEWAHRAGVDMIGGQEGADPAAVVYDAVAAAKAGKADEKTVDVNVLETGGKTTHSYVYYFFAYVPYILLCLCIVGISPVLVVLHKPQIRERIQCSSYSFAKTNRETILGTLSAGLLFGILYLVCAVIVERVFTMQGGLHCLNLLAFLMVALGIVFLIGQVMKKAETVSMVSNVIALGMSFLSGVFVPIEFLGDGIIKAAHFLPAYWYIMGARLIDSGNYQSSPDLLWRYMGIEVLFAACFVCLGLALARAKRQTKQTA